MVSLAGAFTMDVQVQPEAIRMGESAQLTISLQGVDRGPEPRVPEVSGLRFSGPSREQSFSMRTVNGRMEQQRALNYRWTIIPLQPGEYQIGPIQYTYNNETLTAPPRTLRVVMPSGDPDDTPTQLSDLIFAKLTVDKDRVFVQEPFLLTISIFSRGVNLGRDISLMNMPDSGIQTQPFQELRSTREIVGDDIYDVRRYQTLIRPLTSGTLRFEPTLQVQILVPRRQQRTHPFFDDAFFQGFFSNTEVHPFELSVDPIDVVVRSLPDEDRPASFTGGVGQFDFQVRAQDIAVAPGDPITLTFLIEGNGNLDALNPPALAESELFRVFPPRVTHTDLDRAGVRGRRLFEQVIIPRTAESTEVPILEFSFFDPGKHEYVTIAQGPFPLELREGADIATRVVRGDGTTGDPRTRIVGQDIRYLMPAPDRWASAYRTPWYQSPWLYLFHVIPALTLAAVYVLARHRRSLDADVAKARRYRAPRSARAGLKEAEKALQQEDTNAFYDGLWHGLTHYFGDRLNLASGAVTTDVVLETLRAQGVSTETQTQAESLFAACEQRRFARLDAQPEQMRAQLTDFKALLKNCERHRA